MVGVALCSLGQKVILCKHVCVVCLYVHNTCEHNESIDIIMMYSVTSII